MDLGVLEEENRDSLVEQFKKWENRDSGLGAPAGMDGVQEKELVSQ